MLFQTRARERIVLVANILHFLLSFTTGMSPYNQTTCWITLLSKRLCDVFELLHFSHTIEYRGKGKWNSSICNSQRDQCANMLSLISTYLLCQSTRASGYVPYQFVTSLGTSIILYRLAETDKTVFILAERMYKESVKTINEILSLCCVRSNIIFPLSLYCLFI